MERLWAPWRIGYVAKDSQEDEPSLPEPSGWQPGAAPDCFLCRAAADFDDLDTADKAQRVIGRGRYSVALLNRYPYSNGHLLVAPRRHVADLVDLSPEEHLELMQTLSVLSKSLRERIKAVGFNIGLNVGDVAGAGVPGHLHWHIVPRWPGDHNFMPTIAGARIIPQSLEAVWELLRDVLPNQRR